jgi:diguanylate cyclase (GGDEF)-like protein
MNVEKVTRRQQDRASLLIVDDQPNNIKVLFDFLVDNGFRVLVAQDGESALQKAANAAPHLILLDVMMPGIDGFETCRRLKQEEATKDIPVIFMTALSDTPYSVKGFEVGAVDYVTKPIRQEEILARVKTQLSMRKMYDELKEKSRILNLKNAQLQDEVRKREQAEAELRKANEMLYRLATVDGLTEVPNRRYFDDYLQREWQRAIRESSALSFILCDIDHFKRYNDRYGHLEGDSCLKAVAKGLESALRRGSDIVARYGGEEFGLLLPDTGCAGALEVTKRVQAAIRELAIRHEASDVDEYLTVSLGVATLTPSRGNEPARLIDAADQALYMAKREGRNCVVSSCTDTDNG